MADNPFKITGQIRVRFAPSPTGFLHIGGLRNVLYNYLLVKKYGGQFTLRLDDTDQKRFVPEAADAIIQGLKWAGIEPNEGFGFGDGPHAPYVQSQRKDLYLAAAEKLLESGNAYYCFCSAERLEEMRKDREARHLPPRYDRHCAEIPLAEARGRIVKGEKATIRFRLPDDRWVTVHDLVRGEVSWHTSDLQDMVIVKSDGLALYHLASVYDDAVMKMTHVIRSEEWLPSLPIHILLAEALGYTPPQYAHLPVILNDQRKKLSKRNDSVALRDFIEKGVLPEAMINFLAFLGWNPGGEREIFSLSELIQEFSIERLHKAGAVFDYKKLENINAYYIRQKPINELVGLIKPYLEKADFTLSAGIDLSAAASTVRERMKYLSEAPDLLGFYFQLPDYDFALLCNEKMKVDKEIARQSIDILLSAGEKITDWTEDKLREVLLLKVAELGWKNGQLLWPMRVALTGEQFSPGSFEVAGVLGKEESLRRLEIAQKKFLK
ncbi:MAG: glutamate--tRNA ligase [Patescibacteria group bacterium]|nr:glutamate--tRNA ligase [Patescibacteria group bacterium]